MSYGIVGANWATHNEARSRQNKGFHPIVGLAPLQVFYSEHIMKHLYTTICTIGLLAGCATDRPLQRGNASADSQIAVGSEQSMATVDSEFAQKACQATVAKLELGRLAFRTSRNPEVRKLARTLISEHTDAARELSRLLKRKGVEPNLGLTCEHETCLEKLAALRGSEFDRAFKEHVVRCHETAVEFLEKQRTDGHDSDLRKFAERTLPLVCEHLTAARALTLPEDAMHTRVISGQAELSPGTH
jgi:putative membrane protein